MEFILQLNVCLAAKGFTTPDPYLNRIEIIVVRYGTLCPLLVFPHLYL